MVVNKEIIFRIISSFIIFAIIFRVMGPILFNFFKSKMPGQHDSEHDIDLMIKRQKERMRVQYGLAPEISSTPQAKKLESQEIKTILNETKWGGGEFQKNIGEEISRLYSYSISPSKISSFILFCDKKNFLSNLSSQNAKSLEAIKNFYVSLLIFLMMIDEVKEKNFFILSSVAKKLNMKKAELAFALQIKILNALKKYKPIKDEQIFSEKFSLHLLPDDHLSMAIDLIIKMEANIWAKSHSLFFEELSIELNYASLLEQLPTMKNSKDYETAFQILGVSENDSLEDIKKTYKKIAMTRHPDKISSQGLPKILESRAINQFNKIQSAYQALLEKKSK